MTQTNPPPGEIKCPHCGQTYAIGAEQWPQYQGRSITCTQCAKQFVVGGAAGPATLPPPMPMTAAAAYPPQGYGYAPPPKKGMSGGVIALIVVAVAVVPCGVIALLISILLPALNKVREEALKAKCASNLKNIAAAMITYSNTDQGQYPDSMATLVRTSGISPAVLICPDSPDTLLTVSPSTVSEAQLAGHCSYIYVAGGMTSKSSGPSDVLAYESNADHHGKGINVLYGDYHVSWLTAAQARQMIASLPPPATNVPPPPSIPAPKPADRDR